MNRTYSLLVEDHKSDPSTLAVIKDVDLSDTKRLRDKLTLILTEHYDADAVIKKIPAYPHEGITGIYFPCWTLDYEIDGGEWTGEIEISCVTIY